MKRVKELDIILLLGMLLLFSCCISFIYSIPINTQDQEVWAQMNPFMMARNEKKLAQVMVRLPLEQQKRLLQELFSEQKSALTPEDKINVVFSMVITFTDQKKQLELLKVLIENNEISKKIPLFYIASEGQYDKIIPLLITALSDSKKQNEWAYKALQYAISKNTPEIVNQLLQQLSISEIQATQLLWEVIDTKKDPEFITELIQKAHANPDDKRKGYTPLIAAVNANNINQVQALLESGASKDIVADVQVGSALQLAMRKRYTEIEQFLRKKGARE